METLWTAFSRVWIGYAQLFQDFGSSIDKMSNRLDKRHIIFFRICHGAKFFYCSKMHFIEFGTTFRKVDFSRFWWEFRKIFKTAIFQRRFSILTLKSFVEHFLIIFTLWSKNRFFNCLFHSLFFSFTRHECGIMGKWRHLQDSQTLSYTKIPCVTLLSQIAGFESVQELSFF